MRCRLPGPQLPGANRELAGQMRLGAGREGRDLLVPDMDPLDLALAAERVGQTVQAVADDAVDALDAGRSQRLGELDPPLFFALFILSMRRRRPANAGTTSHWPRD